MHGNRVPFHRVAVREFSREDTEEREHHSSSRVQERQRGRAHVKGALELVVWAGGQVHSEAGLYSCIFFWLDTRQGNDLSVGVPPLITFHAAGIPTRPLKISPSLAGKPTARFIFCRDFHIFPIFWRETDRDVKACSEAPGQNCFTQQGTGPGQPPRQTKSASANDRAGCDLRGWRAEEDQAIAERSTARAATRDGQMP
jgi:hypothetical protein